MSRRAASIALVAYVVVLAVLTLGASPGAVFAEGADAAHRIDGLEWVTSGDVERTANVLLFIPAGLLLCSLMPRTSRWLVWLLCAAASVGVEAAQLFLPDRQSSLVDVITNSTGAAIGVLLQVVLPSRHSPGRKCSHRQE